MCRIEDLNVIISPKQAAELLNITPRQVYNLLERGEIVGARFGKLWRINRDELLKRAKLV